MTFYEPFESIEFASTLSIWTGKAADRPDRRNVGFLGFEAQAMQGQESATRMLSALQRRLIQEGIDPYVSNAK
jgi:hypothetical protein